jgi:hypothetical protein
MQPFRRITWPIIAIFLVLVLATATLYFAVNSVAAKPEIILGLTIIIGASILLILLFLITTGFSVLQLDDRTQALGLPDGSIRALIAFLLILIWVIVSLYLTAFVANPPANSPDAGRFAEGVYSTMATLVVAVVAFYFGSKNVAAATAAVAGTLSQPTIISADPQTGTQGQTGISLTIKGSNFQSPSSVRLSRETQAATDEIIATNVLSNATQITCTIDIKNDQTLGEWDLIVINSDGGKGQKPNAFIINPHP